ncbi:MAG: hypothetical protein GWO07_05910 [Candidatus Dadabacteria bacterium]|nr:hypothetical protein [Candidatus Dadabacteria bacterium]NIS08290.1 hypothetical protein [Candidatus Dadabacteria bacterium]NIV12155.1 hypothetical protein [Fodinibius sp.]NIY21809.1 hypothetical protein [Candidatus Dadabacteria bacterium]
MKQREIRRDDLSGESGIAVVIALVMLLVMSVMAISISFMSNTEFKTASTFKRGQEAFLAGETCIEETIRTISEQGIALILFKQSAQSSDKLLIEPLDINLAENINVLAKDSDDLGAVCRSGTRIMDGANEDPIFILPENVKSISRIVRNTVLPDSGTGGALAVPVIFSVVGKDSQDEDKDDSDIELNTGTQLAVGVEVFTGGGASNVY